MKIGNYYWHFFHSLLDKRLFSVSGSLWIGQLTCNDWEYGKPSINKEKLCYFSYMKPGRQYLVLDLIARLNSMQSTENDMHCSGNKQIEPPF